MVKILVVDDAEFFRKLYSEALTKVGFEVETAENGLDAVEKIRSFQPRLVFMDYVMPEATGGQALELIKADESIKRTPVVMLTSISAEVKGEDLLMLGAVAYLEKDTTTGDDIVKTATEILGTADAPLDPMKG